MDIAAIYVENVRFYVEDMQFTSTKKEEYGHYTQTDAIYV